MDRYYQEDIERAPRDEITAIQNGRLRATVERVYNNVPFYRSHMDAMGISPDDIKSIDDIARLPFTTKQDIRDGYPFGFVAAPMDDVVRMHATSGTTGKKVIACYTQNDLDVWASCCARALAAAGATKADKVHISYGYGLFTGGLGLDGGSRKLGALTIPVSSGNTKQQLQLMEDLGSTVLGCTPSYAAYLGESVAEAGLRDRLKLRIGICGAEPWSEEMRQDIQEKLGIRAYNIYGLTEVMGPGVAYECSEQNGMHINEDYFIPEVIDPVTGESLPDGASGELVFTCIAKEAFPLLRYRTRDMCILSHEKCACGRTHARIMKLMGRSDDMLIIRGVNVFPSQIETVLMNCGFSSNYQIVVDRVNNTDTFDILVEMTPDMFSDSVKKIESAQYRLSNEMKSMLGINPHISLVAPKSLERSEGKAKRVIDKRVF